ncbi:MGH1-like glycoside hydrolase domain-containing protein [Tenacibaculum agarivorans]|uniref:MGH1-like glycoside hydrolase domain-containing protein n=1 Tax=Tenacibaculum agarivorans TaxID=1908389 RepID=UPI000AE21065|nr:trehalase family glycosidase [Tenacibaculum agarivorans]
MDKPMYFIHYFMKHHELITKAQEVLNNNYQEKGFTIPCQGLYPFQWNWDSGFIAIGFAHFDMEKAKKEIKTLIDSQWSNGFIPHIIFHNESDTYFPGPDFHRSDLSKLSNTSVPTTGMTQPHILGFALERMYKVAENKEDVLQFIKENIDAIYDFSMYFYNHRDPLNEGLAYIYHNWESGTDNSPIWDDIWSTMDSPSLEFQRRDTSHVDASQRPSKREYDHYLHIIEIAKKYNYEDAKIAEFSPFLVQDPLFNAVLISSNKSLIRLYELIGGNEEKVTQLKHLTAKSIHSFNTKLFDEALGAYCHYDLRTGKLLRYVSSSSFSPLYAGIPSKEQAEKLVYTMMKKFGKDDQYLCASFDPTHERFNPKQYWRGPVWINLNWLLYHGFKNYGYKDIAERIKQESIEIIEKNGFYEYFDARKEAHKDNTAGYGGNNFSWSAALLIDLLSE